MRYCSLYDEGYTSLGGVHNTTKNASLRRADGSYAPAHTLVDGNQVRRLAQHASTRLDAVVGFVGTV